MIAGGDEIGSPLDITGILASFINLVPAGFPGFTSQGGRASIPVKLQPLAIPKIPGGLQFGSPVKITPAAPQPSILQELIQWYLQHQPDYSQFPIPADWQTWIKQFVRATLDASINAFEAWISAHKPVDPPVPIGFLPTCSSCQLVAGGLPPGDYQEELI